MLARRFKEISLAGASLFPVGRNGGRNVNPVYQEITERRTEHPASIGYVRVPLLTSETSVGVYYGPCSQAMKLRRKMGRSFLLTEIFFQVGSSYFFFFLLITANFVCCQNRASLFKFQIVLSRFFRRLDCNTFASLIIVDLLSCLSSEFNLDLSSVLFSNLE